MVYVLIVVEKRDGPITTYTEGGRSESYKDIMWLAETYLLNSYTKEIHIKKEGAR